MPVRFDIHATVCACRFSFKSFRSCMVENARIVREESGQRRSCVLMKKSRITEVLKSREGAGSTAEEAIIYCLLYSDD